MLTLKFQIAGQPVEVSTENADEAMQLLSSFAPHSRTMKIARVGKVGKRGKYHKSGHARSWTHWNVEEVRALVENKNLSSRELRKLPLLEGRSPRTIRSMRSAVKNNNFTYMPSNFRKAMEAIQAGQSQPIEA